MFKTRFLGTGHFVPELVVTNDDLSRRMETSDEWIQKRTGIKTRRHVDFDKTPMGASDLACHAAKKALHAAQISAQEIDLIVYATLSPDRQFPGDGVLVQHKLGMPAGTPALDIRNQCSGFLYGLSVADAFIRSGTYKKILLIGAEVHSTGLDFTTRGRDVAVLFGDGAAAVVLGAESQDGVEQAAGVLGVCLHADGRYAEELRLDFPSSAHMPRVDLENLQDGSQFPSMNGKNVFKHAVTRMPEAILEILGKHQYQVSDIDLLITHQANLRISEMVQQKLGLQDDKVFNNIMHYGNTTAASIPLAIDEAIAQKRLKKGDLLCCASFGAGFTWGAALIRL